MTNSIIHDVMPGWNGSESIVAYSIRMRREARELAARQQAVRLMVLATMTPAVLAAVVGFTAMICDIILHTY